MTWSLDVENVAGIQRGRATLEPGLNAVRAGNWRGKSSFLAAIEAVMGTAAPLTEGRAAGSVTLTTDDETYAVELTRSGRSVSTSGTPYLSAAVDRVCADLFAFLDEGNEVRRAVREGDPLEPLLTRPLDFEDIDERIAEVGAERDRVDDELDAAESAAERVPALESRVRELETEVEDLTARREATTDRTADDETRTALSDARAELARVESRIDRLESTAGRTRERLSETEAELESIEVPSADGLESALADAREELRRHERDVELLRSVYEANRRIVAEGRLELLGDVSHDVVDDELVCWVCGDETTRSAVESRLDALADRIDDRRSAAEAARDRVDEVEGRVEERDRLRRRRNELQSDRREATERLGDVERRLAEARDRESELRDRIASLRETVAAETDRLTDVESDLKYARTQLAEARDELEAVEDRASRRSSLRAQREALTEEIADLRRRRRAVRQRTRDAFDEAIADIVALFETGFESARLTGDFELVVAREGREVPLDALSEGEVELLGFVAALAGYEAFDVADRVPVLLVDRLGGVADENLGRLTEYLAGRTRFLVMTAYPEHTSVTGHEIDPTEWSVVSDAAGSRAD